MVIARPQSDGASITRRQAGVLEGATPQVPGQRRDPTRAVVIPGHDVHVPPRLLLVTQAVQPVEKRLGPSRRGPLEVPTVPRGA